MLEYSIKNILRRWPRSLMTVIGVAIMMTLVIVITGIVNYQVRTMNAHAAAGSGKINVQSFLAGSSYPAEGIDLAETTADGVLEDTSAYNQAALSSKVLYFTIEPPLYPNQPPDLILTGIEPGREEAFTGSISQNVDPVAGVEFFAEADVKRPVVLGEHAAELYAVSVGETVTILDQTYTVIGVLGHSADMVVNNAAIIPLDQAQELLEKSGFVSSVILAAVDIHADADIQRVIESGYPRLTVVTDDTVRRNAREGIGIFEAMVNTISAVVVLCAAMLIMTVMLITVKERTKEIGVLRALGAAKRTVIGALLWEVFLLSLIGSLVGGVLSGFILAFVLDENLFDLMHILTRLPLALVLTMLAGLLPALNISRILPIEALSYE